METAPLHPLLAVQHSLPLVRIPPKLLLGRVIPKLKEGRRLRMMRVRGLLVEALVIRTEDDFEPGACVVPRVVRIRRGRVDERRADRDKPVEALCRNGNAGPEI